MAGDTEDDLQWKRELARELRKTDPSPSSMMDGRQSMLAAGGIMAGVSLLVGLQFPFLFPKSAPYMATPGSKIRHALQFLNKTSKKSHDNRQVSKLPPLFVDLGSGDGQAVYEAARLGYRAVGIEFNWTLWAVSSIRRQLFWTPQEKSLSTFLRQDFHSYNLRDADTIMIFAIPRTMPVLGTKIQQECKSGTDVLAYRFGIPLAINVDDEDGQAAIPTDLDQDVRLHADLIYDREDMRIYRMKDKHR